MRLEQEPNVILHLATHVLSQKEYPKNIAVHLQQEFVPQGVLYGGLWNAIGGERSCSIVRHEHTNTLGHYVTYTTLQEDGLVGFQLSPSVEVKEEGMLQDIRELNDEDLLVEGVMRGLVAYDPETRAELTRGTGRRKLGRPQRYTVNAPNGEKMTRSFRDGDREVDRMRPVFHLTAFTDSEALEKAQKMFSKKYETFRDTWGRGSGAPPQSIGE